MKQKITALLLCLLLAAGLCGCGGEAEPAGELEIRFFSLGKADAFLLRTEESAVLIDAGTNKDGKMLAGWLRQNGVERLDALFITHFDRDHVGGADKILENIAVDAVYEPDYFSESKQVTQYREALAESGTPLFTLDKNTALSLDGVDYVIDVANQTDYGPGEENDFSLVISVRHGDCRLLFTGDAERPRLSELMAEGELPHDFLKVPHHGVWEKNSAAFFEAVSPRWALITSSGEEPEDPRTVAALEALGTEVFLTREGPVRCISDGNNLHFSQESAA